MANVEPPGAEFVERFADALVIAGVPRMPARVLALLTATDDARLTASELGEALHASPAAISGAVRYLEQVNLVRRTRHRGSRRDHFVLEGDIWYQNIVGRMGLVQAWAGIMREGAEALGHHTPAGRRLLESAGFFEFLVGELPKAMERWQQFRHSPGLGRSEPEALPAE